MLALFGFSFVFACPALIMMTGLGPSANVVTFRTDGRHRRHVQRNAGGDGPPDQG